MTLLVLVLAAAPWAMDAREAPKPPKGRQTVCSVVPLSETGDESRGVPAYSATEILSIRFRARVRLGRSTSTRPALKLNVYAPNGDLYDILEAPLAAPRPTHPPSHRVRGPGPPLQAEARLPVAGSGILNSSLYGRWTVVPQLEGEASPCGRAHGFAIEPRGPGAPHPPGPRRRSGGLARGGGK